MRAWAGAISGICQDKSDPVIGISSLSCHKSCWGVKLNEAEHALAAMRLLALFVACWTEGREETRAKSLVVHESEYSLFECTSLRCCHFEYGCYDS
jgi:succinate dehydrogenase/fumarate reductase-like Fe-S protein